MHTRILEMKLVRNLTAMAAVAAALIIATQARAATISTESFYLTTPEGGPVGSLAQSDAVEVTVNLMTGNTTATVIFTNCSAAGCGTDIGAPVELNVRGTFTATSTEGVTTAPGCCGEGAGYFGTMDLETGSSGMSTITINLTATGTNSWANAAAVLFPTTGGTPGGFEALIADGENGKQDAGLAATPLPAALPLFAGGLGLLGMFTRRRKQKVSAFAAA